MSIRVSRPLIVGAMFLLLAGCGQGLPNETTGASASFETRLQTAIAEAEAGGASDAQLAIIDRAKATGKVSVEDVRSAAQATVACLDAQGIRAEYFEDKSNAGLIRPNYRAALDESEATENLISECDAQEFKWANYLYNFQDSAVEITQQYVEEKTPALRACLAKNGHPMDEDASFDELLAETDILDRETDGAVNCLLEAGLDYA